MASVDQPLSDTDYARIAIMLERSHGKGAMNLEMLDGFFAALICGPDMVPPSEYLREIWGGDRIGGEGFRDEAEMQEFFELIMPCPTGTAWPRRSTQANRSCRFFWKMKRASPVGTIGHRASHAA